ncbi:MAG: hypothetical protein IPN89_05630 [Saprospiraceae bacterium]|nr:hypothetical protein [Saprospiraceae bacterium]
MDRTHAWRPQSNWRSIEAENQQDIYAQWLKTVKSNRSGDELVAEGQILGQWIERGSNNNAGNIMVTEFDANEEVIYAVGGGGPMFKGDLSGFGWTLVNDQLRFSTSLLKILPLTGGGKRIISAVNGIPHYSNDDGVTWKKQQVLLPQLTDGICIMHNIPMMEKYFFWAKKTTTVV